MTPSRPEWPQLWAAVFLLVTLSANASDTISGQVFANGYFATVNASHNPAYTQAPTQSTIQVEEGAWLTGDYDFNKSLSVHATLTGQQLGYSAAPSNLGFGGSVREGYFEAAQGGIDLKVGRQIISWGKTDGINPTDYFSGFDYTIFNSDSEYERLAPDSVLFSFTPDAGRSHFNLTLVYVVNAPRNKILLFSDQQSGQFVVNTASAPRINTENAEGGGKISYSGRGWDASLSAYYGQNHTPDFQLGSFSVVPTPQLVVNQFYQPIFSSGGDFSITLGSWVIRGEGAYVYVRDIDPSSDPSILPDHFDGVLGVERPIGDLFRVSAQMIYRYVQNWQEPEFAVASGTTPQIVNQRIAESNQLIEGMQNLQELGASLRLSFSDPDSGFDGELFALGYSVRSDYLIRPMLTYHWTGACKTFAGWNYYGGPDDTPFGAFNPYSAAFVGGVYLF